MEPATGQELGRVGVAGPDDVRRAADRAAVVGDDPEGGPVPAAPTRPVEAAKRVSRNSVRVRRRPGPGRPSVMTDEMIRDANEMYASGEYTAEAIARELRVSRSTVFRYLEN